MVYLQNCCEVGVYSTDSEWQWHQLGHVQVCTLLQTEWQWHQLGHVQVCTLLQTDNHTRTPPFCFLQAGCPSCRPANSVKALYYVYQYVNILC